MIARRAASWPTASGSAASGSDLGAALAAVAEDVVLAVVTDDGCEACSGSAADLLATGVVAAAPGGAVALRLVVDRVLDGGAAVAELEVETPGRRRWVASVRPSHHDPSRAVVLVAHDVTGLTDELSRLRHDVDHDALTGLLNRRALLRLLAGHLADPAAPGAAGVGVLFADVDEFKAVNDRHGHGAGDLVLVEVARRLGSVARPADHVGRLGGDEFIVVRPAASNGDLDDLAVRVTRAFEAPVDAGGRRVRVRLSLGRALVGPGGNPGDVLELADLAMYRDRAAGRVSAGPARPWWRRGGPGPR